MKESWEEQLRQRLEGHEMAPPEGLWEDLCKELGMTPEPALTPSARSTNMRWYYTAAAVLLALAGFFAIYQLNNNVETKVIAVKSEKIPPVQSDTPATEVPKEDDLTKSQTPCETTPCETTPCEPRQSGARPCEPTSCESEDVMDKEEPQQPESEESVPESHASESPVPESPVSEPSASEPQAKKPAGAPVINQPLPSELLPKRNATPDRWSLDLTASGGLLAANNLVNTNPLFNPINPHSDIGKTEADYNNSTSNSGESFSQTKYVWTHRLPVRFGLGVQYRLNDRLSLLSGISYTYLYSECVIPIYENTRCSQKLHYLGVPLGIVWQLWSAGHFRIYLSGGAMLEKYIGGSFDNKRADDFYGEKPWQWSVNAAAGGEYSFTPQFGVYLEPSLGYYFDDGTYFEHYYKEHPLAPSISFGLRFNLNK